MDWLSNLAILLSFPIMFQVGRWSQQIDARETKRELRETILKLEKSDGEHKAILKSCRDHLEEMEEYAFQIN